MLISLAFLEEAEPWPPDDEDTQTRLDLYAKNRLLFESKAESVYGRWVQVLRENLEETHSVISFHQRLSWHWANLVLGEAPEYTVGEPESAEQQALETLVEDTELTTIGQEVLVDRSRYGDGLFRLRLEDGQAVIEGQSPEYWFPVVSETNVRKILYHCLAWTFQRTEKTTTIERLGNPAVLTKQVRYLRIEIHSAGRLEHRLYRLNTDSRIAERLVSAEARAVILDWPIQEVEDTGLDVPLVFHASGERTTDRLHGYDDYTPVDSSLEYLMWISAQRQVILHKHSDPSIAGPEMAQEVVSETGSRLHASGSRYYEIDPDAAVFPQYLTWDGNLEASFRQTDELWKDVYTESHTSPASFNHSETGQGTSGTELRLRLRSDIAKAGQIAERFFPVLTKVIKAAGTLSGQDFEALTITPRDGLPADNMEAAQISALDIGSGITSKKSEMKRRYELNDEQAAKELDQIDEETAMPPALTAFGNTSNLDGGGDANGTRQKEGRQ